MSNVARGWAVSIGLLASMMVALAVQAPQAQGAAAAPPQGRGAPPAAPRGGGGLSAGPADLPTVDTAAADRGRTVYASECINCHGTQARGGDKGANLVRSVVVLRDRYGSQLGPFMKKGHPLQTGAAGSLTDAQITDLAHFLRQRVNDSLRGSPIFKAGNVLTGDPAAGADYFKGAGRCSSCHPSRTDLAGIGGRFTAVDLQQRFLFPRTGRGGGGRAGRGTTPATNPVTVSVTPRAGTAVSGVLVQMDDFNVSLRDAAGALHSFKRTPDLRVVKTDPLEAHIALLDTITEKQLHDVVAYLETMK